MFLPVAASILHWIFPSYTNALNNLWYVPFNPGTDPDMIW